MAIQNNSLKQRKKEASKGKLQQANSEESRTKRSESNFGTSNFWTYSLYVVYITAFLAVVSCLSWLILCNTLCKELSFCSTQFLRTFIHHEGNLNDSKTCSTPKPPVLKDESSLWVVERRSNLSLSEFIEKYDGKRLVVWF